MLLAREIAARQGKMLLVRERAQRIPKTMGLLSIPSPGRRASRLLGPSWIRRIAANPLRMWMFEKHFPKCLETWWLHSSQDKRGHLVVTSHREFFSLVVPRWVKLKCDFEEEKDNSCSFPGWVLYYKPQKVCGAFCLTKTMCSVLWTPLAAAEVVGVLRE